MTAIAWRDGLLAVDSLASCGPAHRLIQSKAKLIKGWVVTGCGSLLDTEKIWRFFENLTGPSTYHNLSAEQVAEVDWPPLKDEDSVVVFWQPKVRVILRADCYPEISYQNMDAFACSSFLLGAMHGGQAAEDAVALACWHVQGCGFPVEVYGQDTRDGPVKLVRTLTAHDSLVPDTTKSGLMTVGKQSLQDGSVIWGNKTIEGDLSNQLKGADNEHY